MKKSKQAILDGKTTLGIELGSTRIKAILVDETNTPLASGSFEWENQYENEIWTYSLEMVWTGLQNCYKSLKSEVKSKYDIILTKIGAIGISAMMHGYLAFGREDRLLVPFRTWRNTMTEEAAQKLTKEFSYNIPERFSIAHLQQAIINKEDHINHISYLTTLAGYVHWQLTGKKVLGVGDASGMFPIDTKTKDFNEKMLSIFDEINQGEIYTWKIREILPVVLSAGEPAGYLTETGARLLDVSGELQAGILMCPPEGDAGTGMIATNSIKERTGNVSAGTSIFAMIVLEKELSKVYSKIDLVTTPDGSLVGMVHCNNCTSDLNAWIHLFQEFSNLAGIKIDTEQIFSLLYKEALKGDNDCGNMMAYNYFSGETITGFEEGRPLFVRMPNSKFNLANFMRVHLFTSLGALKVGMDILTGEEQVRIDKMFGHGGLFRTKEVGQRFMSAAMETSVSVLETAGEGGAWGIAVLASYLLNKKEDESLCDYLEYKVFHKHPSIEKQPNEDDVRSFSLFMKRYQTGLSMERAAIEGMK